MMNCSAKLSPPPITTASLVANARGERRIFVFFDYSEGERMAI